MILLTECIWISSLFASIEDGYGGHQKRMKKESDSGSSPPPRKLKFVPKVPVRKLPKPHIVKIQEPSDNNDAIVDKELLAKLSSAKSRDELGRRFLSDKKAIPAQVTFGSGHTSSTQVRSFGTSKCKTKTEDGFESQTKEYVAPWDYHRSYYPVSLPLRRPYSGDPEVLDRLEFGEGGSAHLPINESHINAAHELGFMETEPKMIFLQFPSHLPFMLPAQSIPDEENRPETQAGNMPHGEAKGRERTIRTAPTRACQLKDLPAGFMGKLLVYRSGKVKMKLGDALFNVSPGVNHTFAEEVVAVNAKEKQYCVLGELSKHAVVSQDMDQILADLVA